MTESIEIVIHVRPVIAEELDRLTEYLNDRKMRVSRGSSRELTRSDVARVAMEQGILSMDADYAEPME